jgi:hypothetical protein
MEQHCAHTTVFIKISYENRHMQSNFFKNYVTAEANNFHTARLKKAQTIHIIIPETQKIFKKRELFEIEEEGQVWWVIHQGRPRPLWALLGPLNPRPLPSPLPLQWPDPDPGLDG